MRDKECLLPPSCDSHVCSDDSICVIENNEPTCSQFHCENVIGGTLGEYMAVGVTDQGNIACKTENLSNGDGSESYDKVCATFTSPTNDSLSCVIAVKQNLENLSCGQEYYDEHGCTGYDKCGETSDGYHFCDSVRTDYLDDLKQSSGHECVLNAYNDMWYAVGFENGDYYCLADQNFNCNEYPAGEQSSGKDACYRSLLSEDWHKSITCGEDHSYTFGCSGYDGCGSGEHWCKYLQETGVCSCESGTGAKGLECLANGVAKCESCHAGYNLQSDACIENMCSCESGDGAVGLDCSTDGVAKCNSCDYGYDLQSDTCTKQVQYLMYTTKASQTIYSYTLDVDQVPINQIDNTFTIPFSTSLPGLVFNYQSNSLEIVGDYFNGDNSNHFMMSTHGSFSAVTNNLFEGDDFSEVAYSRGTAKGMAKSC